MEVRKVKKLWSEVLITWGTYCKEKHIPALREALVSGKKQRISMPSARQLLSGVVAGDNSALLPWNYSEFLCQEKTKTTVTQGFSGKLCLTLGQFVVCEAAVSNSIQILKCCLELDIPWPEGSMSGGTSHKDTINAAQDPATKRRLKVWFRLRRRALKREEVVNKTIKRKSKLMEQPIGGTILIRNKNDVDYLSCSPVYVNKHDNNNNIDSQNDDYPSLSVSESASDIGSAVDGSVHSNSEYDTHKMNGNRSCVSGINEVVHSSVQRKTTHIPVCVRACSVELASSVVLQLVTSECTYDMDTHTTEEYDFQYVSEIHSTPLTRILESFRCGDIEALRECFTRSNTLEQISDVILFSNFKYLITLEGFQRNAPGGQIYLTLSQLCLCVATSSGCGGKVSSVLIPAAELWSTRDLKCILMAVETRDTGKQLIEAFDVLGLCIDIHSEQLNMLPRSEWYLCLIEIEKSIVSLTLSDHSGVLCNFLLALARGNTVEVSSIMDLFLEAAESSYHYNDIPLIRSMPCFPGFNCEGGHLAVNIFQAALLVAVWRGSPVLYKVLRHSLLWSRITWSSLRKQMILSSCENAVIKNEFLQALSWNSPRDVNETKPLSTHTNTNDISLYSHVKKHSVYSAHSWAGGSDGGFIGTNSDVAYRKKFTPTMQYDIGIQLRIQRIRQDLSECGNSLKGLVLEDLYSHPDIPELHGDAISKEATMSTIAEEPERQFRFLKALGATTDSHYAIKTCLAAVRVCLLSDAGGMDPSVAVPMLLGAAESDNVPLAQFLLTEGLGACVNAQEGRLLLEMTGIHELGFMEMFSKGAVSSVSLGQFVIAAAASQQSLGVCGVLSSVPVIWTQSSTDLVCADPESVRGDLLRRCMRLGEWSGNSPWLSPCKLTIIERALIISAAVGDVEIFRCLLKYFEVCGAHDLNYSVGTVAHLPGFSCIGCPIRYTMGLLCVCVAASSNGSEVLKDMKDLNILVSLFTLQLIEQSANVNQTHSLNVFSRVKNTLCICEQPIHVSERPVCVGAFDALPSNAPEDP
eukprot:GHVR01138422.1.p1 GENE.GHVR01138422.1~~GHVR01138422.1.p1  ORF type:complete len:1126 (-),score=217.14 GHVR01138422.1:471-3569(-)